MESLQNLFSPSLEDLLGKVQYTSPPSANKKHRKKPMSNEDSSQRKKRNRITFDASQVDEMEKVFAQNQYPDATSRDELASRIQLHEERVQIWFQNRRAKYRRELRHTYHPYEPPREEEYPYLKKKSASSLESDASHKEATGVAEVKLLAPIDTAALLANSNLPTPEPTVQSESTPESLSTEAVSMTTAQLAASLSLFMNGNPTSSDDSSPLLVDNTENAVVVENESGAAADQLNSEKANLLMWALSSLFNVQTEAAQS